MAQVATIPFVRVFMHVGVFITLLLHVPLLLLALGIAESPPNGPRGVRGVFFALRDSRLEVIDPPSENDIVGFSTPEYRESDASLFLMARYVWFGPDRRAHHWFPWLPTYEQATYLDLTTYNPRTGSVDFPLPSAPTGQFRSIPAADAIGPARRERILVGIEQELRRRGKSNAPSPPLELIHSDRGALRLPRPHWEYVLFAAALFSVVWLVVAFATRRQFRRRPRSSS